MKKIDQILESLYDRVIEPMEAKQQLLDLFAASDNIDIFGTIMTCSPKDDKCQLCKYKNEPQNSDVCTYCVKHNKSTEYYR